MELHIMFRNRVFENLWLKKINNRETFMPSRAFTLFSLLCHNDGLYITKIKKGTKHLKKAFKFG